MKNRKLSGREFCSQLDSLFGVAKSCKYDAQVVHERFASLLQELKTRTPSGKNRYPYYLRQYVIGYHDALHQHTWTNELEFCYVYQGELYSTHKTSIHKNAKLLYLNRENSSVFMDSLERGHYWKGTNKKFA